MLLPDWRLSERRMRILPHNGSNFSRRFVISSAPKMRAEFV
jgi:hypothetical protein